ncbi:hypothetical protein [Desulfovibrio litoralis]|uniref:Uncharacterized protein n=1 Tax=Desulfovibrio litoralis DSM 11393 TaxID=1121455 RepID=A0A1M7RX15_9BACT|nr:hypothetical protein [Desulfovibrio litoralis]SHN50839.1 hypothetical protein SAMN02745728_00291 [Desulfovibrio litoralis DSM 11393]
MSTNKKNNKNDLNKGEKIKTLQDNSDSPGLGSAVRGILIGTSLGAFSVIFGFYDSMPKAIALGSIGGFLAGITLSKIHQRKKKK